MDVVSADEVVWLGVEVNEELDEEEIVDVDVVEVEGFPLEESSRAAAPPIITRTIMMTAIKILWIASVSPNFFKIILNVSAGCAIIVYRMVSFRSSSGKHAKEIAEITGGPNFSPKALDKQPVSLRGS